MPAKTAPLTKRRGLSRRDPVDDRPRPAVDRGPGDVRRRDHPRRDQGGDDHAWPTPSWSGATGAIFYPAADGATTLTVAYGGKTVTVPVKVAQATVQPPLSFRLDVMPVFMRAGCNTGSCHGAARGKDGFRISLFGFDPEGDHFRLTREMVGRRINLAVPSDSTMLEKATGAVKHTGGKRFEPSSELYQTLHGWIEAGAPNDDAAKLPKVVGVDLYPKQAVLDGKGATQQLTVRARYSDGTDRDVTSLAVFLTNNDVSAPVSPDGLVTAGERGEAFVMARFETHTVGSQFIVLPKGLSFTFPDEPEANYIDKLVNDKLKKLRIAPSGQCDDETFLRRAVDRHRRPAARPSRNTTGSWPRPTPTSGRSGSTSCSSARSSPRSGSPSGPSCSRCAPTPPGTSARRPCSSTTTGWSTSSRRTCRWTRWSRSSWAPAAARSRTPRPTSTRSPTRRCR